MMETSWWVWMAAGFALAALEIVAPGFFFLGFALGAVVVGGLLWLGLLPFGFPALLAIGAVISLLAWIVLRALFPGQRGRVKIWRRDIND